MNYKRHAEWISRVCRDAKNDDKKIKFMVGAKLFNIDLKVLFRAYSFITKRITRGENIV